LKIAIISFGYADSILPLFKHLQETTVNYNLFLCYSLNRKIDSILDFTDINISTGFSNPKKTEEILGPEIMNYLGDVSNIQFFIFHNFKLRSSLNFHLAKTLAERLKSYDIVHFIGIYGVLPIIMYRLRKNRLIFTIHDASSHSGEKTRFNFAEKLNRFIFRSKYPVIVQNVHDFKNLQNEYYKIKDKFRFIPFGELDIYRKFKEEDQKTNYSDLIFFGRISPYKGIEYLINAIENLNSEGIKVKTIIAGQGEIYFDTSRLEELGILLINRYIPNSELVSLISGTKVVVCPYTDATQSGVIMTAFAFNKPVIATDVGSFPEVIKNGITGFLVKPKNAFELASKIDILLSSPELLSNMSNNINHLTTSGEYSWNRITENMVKLYTSVQQQ
jgi:glycosyltransferase involved in cell wall biosynthesis